MSPIVPWVGTDEAPSWASLWMRLAEIGAEAAEVVVRRSGTILRDPWSPAAAAEMRRMVVEKAVAAGDVWLTMWQGLAALWIAAVPRGVVPAGPPAPGAVALEPLLTIGRRLMEPAGAAVSENLARLRGDAAGA